MGTRNLTCVYKGGKAVVADLPDEEKFLADLEEDEEDDD